MAGKLGSVNTAVRRSGKEQQKIREAGGLVCMAIMPCIPSRNVCRIVPSASGPWLVMDLTQGGKTVFQDGALSRCEEVAQAIADAWANGHIDALRVMGHDI